MSYQLPVTSYQLSVTNYQLSVIRYLLFPVPPVHCLNLSSFLVTKTSCDTQRQRDYHLRNW
ncbi:hypothetical protein SD80_014810 [Scytonema tolypothrichoides VB-61278]|nr:hypothetical protein SD80_014810 [Scytonema tolypothrichoides VB-61278]